MISDQQLENFLTEHPHTPEKIISTLLEVGASMSSNFFRIVLSHLTAPQIKEYLLQAKQSEIDFYNQECEDDNRPLHIHKMILGIIESAYPMVLNTIYEEFVTDKQV